jgi:hypothetical protein
MADCIKELREITVAVRWSEIAKGLDDSSSHIFDQDAFGTYWIEAGHRIREQVGDDRALAKLLRLMLPPYTGGPVALYRGENRDRLAAGFLGFAWTSNLSVAEMFASGLNSVGSGGVVLSATFDAPAIICGPNAHSSYLGEEQFTVDPFYSAGIEELTSFASVAGA